MADRDTHIRWIHDVIDRASAKSRAISSSIAKDVAVQDAALQKSLASQIKASSTREQLALRERRQWRELTSTAARADREISRAVAHTTTAVDRATLKQVEALRRQGAAYREIAIAARRHGATASATAAAIEHAASREVAAYERVAAASAKAQASTAAARSSAAGFVGGAARRATATAGVAASFGVYASARQTIDFDREMRNANALAQLGERAYARLSARTRDLARETAQMPRTIAEGLGTLIGSGFDANESLLILRSSAKAATAGLTDTGTSTAAVAAVLNAYRLRADEAANVSDTLFRTVDQGVIRFETLAQNIGDVLPFASSLGVSLNEVGAATATMTKAGISGPETMTRIKAVMTALIKPSEDLAREIRRQGFESAEAMLKARGFQGTLDDIAESTGGSKQRLATMFRDVRALGGALALTGRNSASANQDVRSLADSAGAMSQALTRQAQSVSYQWDRLKATSAALAIEVGTDLVPAMTSALQASTEFAQDFFAGATGRRPLGGAVNDAYELGDAVRNIADTAGPVVKDMAEIAAETASFVGHNPELRRLVAILIAAGAAAKAIKFAAAITGVNQLVAGAGRLRRTGVLGGAGAAGRPGVAGGGGRWGAVRGTGLALGGAGVAVGGSIAGGALGGVGGSTLAGAAQGAGLGLIAGPWGAAGGAIFGAATSALIGSASSKNRKEAEAEARRWAQEFTRAVADNVAGGLDPRSARELADATTDARRSRAGRRIDVNAYLTRSLGGPSGGAFGAPAGMRIPVRRYSRQEMAEIFEGSGPVSISPRILAQARREGRRVVDAFVRGQGRRFTTGRFMLEDFRSTFGRLNPLAQQMGTTAVARYSRGLERSGRVARGTTERLIRAIARDFDGLAPRLASASARSTRALDRGLRGEQIIQRANRIVDRIGNRFDGLPNVVNRSVAGSAATIATYLDRLSKVAKDKNAPKEMREQAAAALPGLRKAYDSALGELANSFGGSRRAADRWARGVSSATREAGAKRGAVRTLTEAIAAFNQKLRDGSTAAEGMGTKLSTLRGQIDGVATAAANMPPFDFADTVPLSPTPPRPRQRRRTGGTIRRYQDGGLVPVMVSSGEELVYGGRSWMVPGPRVADDNVFTMVPAGTEVYTEHGQMLKAAGLSSAQALAAQMPHFATGGVVQSFRRGGRAAGGPWVKVGATVFDDPPPGAFGSLTRGFAELGTARRTDGGATGFGWLAKAFGRSGELPANSEVDFRVGSRVARLRKADRGYGQGGDGVTSDPAFAADFWKDSWSKLGVHGNWKGTAYARPAAGRLESGSYSYMRPPVITRSRAIDLLQPYGALDAFGQGFQSGLEGTRRIFRNWRGLDTDLFAAATSGVRANERDLPKKVTVRGVAGTRAVTASMGGATARQRAIASKILTGASEIVGLPYTYGGHGNPGYDCSSAVLYALNRGGLSSSVGTTDTLKGWGKSGSGRYLTVGVRGTSGKQAHTMMSIAGRYFESGGSSGAGVGWRSGWNGDFPIKRTWPGMRSGGIVGRKRPQIPVAGSVRGRFRANDPRLDPGDPSFVGWGMRAGGVVQAFGGGGRARTTGSLVGTRAVGIGRGPASGSVHQTADWLIHLVGEEGIRADDIIEEMRELGGLLQQTGEVSYRRMARLRRGVHGEIRELMKGGETGRERIQARRLRGVLTLLEGEMGKRVGLIVHRAQRAAEAVGARETRTTQRLTLAGINEGGARGLTALLRSDRRSARGLRAALPSLRRALRRAQEMRDADTVRAVREIIRENRDAARDLRVTRVVRRRERASVGIQSRLDRIETRYNQAQGLRTSAERNLALRGVDTGSAEGMFALRDADVHRQAALRQELPRLRAEAARARRAKQHDLARSIEDTIRTYGDEITQLGVDIQVTSREAAAQARREQVEQIRNAAATQVDVAGFTTGIRQQEMARFEIAQQMAELQGGPRFDSQQAREARANYIRSSIVPALQGELAAIEEQIRAAEATRGDEGGEEAYRAAQAAWQAKQTELAQAHLEAAQEGNKKADEQTDALRQLGGTTSFGFGNQRFTDLINSGVGA